MCIVLPKTLTKLLSGNINNGGKLKPHHRLKQQRRAAQRIFNVIITTQNVQGYSSEWASSKKDHATRIIEQFGPTPTIFLTQETWSDNDTDQEIDNVLFFSHGEPTNRVKGGVGIILSPSATAAWKLAGQPEPIRPGKVIGATRIMALELHFKDQANKIIKLFVITAYLPCSTYSDDDYELTLQKLDEIIKLCPPDAIPIIGGDFNASIGTADPQEEDDDNNHHLLRPIGPFGNPHRNARGEILRHFLQQQGLCSVATFFQKSNHDTWSFAGHGDHPLQIDHLLAPKNKLKHFRNCDTIPGMESDHLMVTSVMHIAKFIPKKKNRKRDNAETINNDETEKRRQKTKIDWDLLRKRKSATFNAELKHILDQQQQQARTEEENDDNNDNNTWTPDKGCPYENLVEAIETAAAKVAPSDGKTKRPPWFRMNETVLMDAIKERDKATINLKTHRSEENKVIAATKRQILLKAKVDARINWLDSKLNEIEQLDNNPRDAWKSFREINAGFTGHHKKAINMKMRKTNGTMAKTDKENAEVMFKHFEKVTNRQELSSYDPTILDEIPTRPTQSAMDTAPTKKEIQHALRKMQYEKSPGTNGIPTEAFKSLTGTNYQYFEETITLFWKNDQYQPIDFQQIQLSILPKKGDLSDPNKWRGIALGDIAAKCISSIIATRLTKYLTTFGIDEQCGSLFGKGCADATFSLKLALQTIREHNQEAFALFVDLVKAYDTVNRELLWKILQKLGIPPQMIKVLQKLYTNVTYHMKIGREKTNFLSTCGVKQGDNLGPILFIFLMQAVATTLDDKWAFKKPDFRWHGIKKDGTPKYNPNLNKGTNYKTKGTPFSFWKSYYVDDAAFLFLNRHDLETASSLIATHFRRFGLTVHCGDRRNNEPSKTEAMHIPAPGQVSTENDTADINLDENQYFSFCKNFKYLGTNFTPELNDSNDIKKRIDQAQRAYYALNRNVLRNKKIPTHLRLRLYNAIVVNLLLWGCESWALKEEDRRKLEVCHHRCLRRMLNITIYEVKDKKISNKEVRKKLNNCHTLSQMIELRRARWLEKISHMNDTRAPRKLIVAWIPNARPTGKPQQTIRHGYATTLQDNLNTSPKLSEWIPMARNHAQWASHVETNLGITSGTYKPTRHSY